MTNPARFPIIFLALVCHGSVAAPLNWQTGAGFRFAPLPVPKVGRTGFTPIPADVTGIYFTNQLAESHSLTNHILLNGSGVAAGDIDGDGLCDLYFCSLDGPHLRTDEAMRHGVSAGEG